MAAKGQTEKEQIIKSIKTAFPAAFDYDKEIRVPIGDVQIKVTLTCAKTNVENGGDAAVPGQALTNTTESVPAPSEKELEDVNNFMAALGL